MYEVGSESCVDALNVVRLKCVFLSCLCYCFRCVNEDFDG